MANSDKYEFGDFVLERSQRRLVRGDGSLIELSPRLFAALLFFVERPGELLTKEVLLHGIWPGLVVEENNLNQAVAALRRTLGEDAHGSVYIQTVPRHGFRFVQQVVVRDALAVATTALPPPAEVSPNAPTLEPRASGVGSGRRRTVLGATVAGAVAVSLGAAGWLTFRNGLPAMATTDSAPAPPSLPPATTTTLAVLPFKPLAAESRDELLELGMADSLISRLSGVSGLVVRSIGSVRPYAGADQDPLRAARELDVAWVVDGTLQRQGATLRATARLLNATDGIALWSGSFDERYTSVFEVQDQISSRVMHALAPALAKGMGRPAEPAELGGTHNTDAYELYLAARWRSQGGRAAEVEKGIALLNQALGIDPAYALAWVELAQVYRRKLWNADGLGADVFEPGDAALRRAMELVPDMAAGHAGIGFSHFWYGFDWTKAEQSFRRALMLNSNTATAHWGLAGLMMSQGRFDDGFDNIQAARSLDPMSPVFNTVEAGYLLGAGRRDEARTRLNHSLVLAPDLWLTQLGYGLLELAEARPAQGLAALRRAVGLSDATRPRAVLGVELVRLGQHDEAIEIQRQLIADSKVRFILPTSLASLHAALGEPQQALGALEHGLEVRDVRMAYLKDDDHWASLRSEARFLALLKTLRLDGVKAGLAPL